MDSLAYDLTYDCDGELERQKHKHHDRGKRKTSKIIANEVYHIVL